MTTKFLIMTIVILTMIEGICSTEYKIGMIVRKECCKWHAMYRIGGSINIALDQVEEDGVLENVTFR